MDAKIDWFSHLPDCILFIIVSFLPFKEAAKTCILSKRWRHVWINTTNVEFNENFFIEEIDGERRELSKRVFLDFARSFVFNYQQSNVREFRVSMSNPNECRSDVEDWIKFAIAKNVQVLDLDFFTCFKLPLFLYEHTPLRVLKLSSCEIEPLELTKFSSLKSLFVERVELSASMLKILISGCRLLETLSLKKCSDLDYIEISSADNVRLLSLIIEECMPLYGGVMICAPKLRSFKYFGAITTFDMDDLCSLVDVELDFGLECDFIELGDLLCELLRNFYTAKVLSVCSYVTQVLPSGEEPLRLRNPLGNLRHLILNTDLHRDELPGITFLLRSCPYLETLTIQMGNIINLNGYIYPFETVADGGLFWASQIMIPFQCLQNHLKSITVNNFRVTENAMRIVEFFLLTAMTLQKLEIVTLKQTSIGDKGSINRRLEQFQRASPYVQVFII